MASLTLPEFTEAVAVLAEHHGVERLRDRLANMNAFTSRRGLNTPAAIAERLHSLTGGLRRQVPGTYAFSSVWTEMVAARVGEDGEKRLESLAERVNACLDPQEAVIGGREEELDQALAEYRETLASVLGPKTADLDMLLKAVPAVAERLRAHPPAAPVPQNAE